MLNYTILNRGSYQPDEPNQDPRILRWRHAEGEGAERRSDEPFYSFRPLARQASSSFLRDAAIFICRLLLLVRRLTHPAHEMKLLRAL